MQRLSLYEYGRAISREQLDRVLAKANISLAYWRMLIYEQKPCTPKTFERIEAASKTVTPETLPDYELCTRPSHREVRLKAKAAAKAAGKRAAKRVLARSPLSA